MKETNMKTIDKDLETIQVLKDNWKELCKFTEVIHMIHKKPKGPIAVGLFDGTMAVEGDWLVKKDNGVIYKELEKEPI